MILSYFTTLSPHPVSLYPSQSKYTHTETSQCQTGTTSGSNPGLCSRCRYNTEQYSPYAAPSPQGSYQPSPSPQSYHQVAPSPVGYQNTHSPASYHPTPSPMAYQVGVFFFAFRYWFRYLIAIAGIVKDICSDI